MNLLMTYFQIHLLHGLIMGGHADTDSYRHQGN